MKPWRYWIAISVGILVLSITAVAVRVCGYPDSVPRAVAGSLDAFVEPGAAVWWVTLGHAFQAFPTALPGYVVVASSNTVMWVMLCAICMAAGRAAIRAGLRLRR
jgi:hypothetical protein